MPKPVLRRYQVDAVENIRVKFREGARRVVLVMPTGGGKTIVGSSIIHSTVGRGNRALFLAHRQELIDQTYDKLSDCDVRAGVIMAKDPRRDDWLPVQIASVQTLVRRLDKKPAANLVVVDECHHAVSETYKKIVAAYPDAYVLGLTATPWRADRICLGDIYDASVLACTPAQLIASGALVDYDAFSYDAPDLHSVKVTAGEYNQKDLGLACNTEVLVGNVVEQYVAHARDRRAIVFPVNIEHSRHLVDQFSAAGFTAEHVDCDTPKEQRKAAMSRFRGGGLTVLSSVGVLTEGFDCLDEQTEVLTANGWRGIGQVKVDDLVYSLHLDTGTGELVPAQRVVERQIAPGERMVTLRSQHINIRTTEGHEFRIKYRDPARGGQLSSGFIKRTGAQLVERRSAYALPIATTIDFPGAPLTDDELRLIAWFMTDGGFERTAFCISQTKAYRNEIRELLSRLELDFGERVRQPGRGAYPNSKPVHVFRIPKGNQSGPHVRRGWVKYAPYLDKNVSPLLQAMTRDQFRVFWSELLKGDGATQRNKAGWLWCDRKAQADAYTALAVVRGFSASFSIQKTKAGRDMFVVSVRDTQWLTSDPGDTRAAKIAFSEPGVGERVWCVTNRNSTLVTRRGGKIAIIGNCPAAEVCILARPTLSLALHLQMIGRVMRPSLETGKARALIHDHAGNLLRHGLPDDDRDYSLTATPERVVRAHTCPACYLVFTKIKDGRCPHCGEAIQPREERLERGDRGDKLVIEGQRISKEQILAMRARREELGLKRPLTDEQVARAAAATRAQKAAEYLRLRDVCQRKGFQPGFVGHQYRETFGVWPQFKQGELDGVEPATKPFFPLKERSA